MISAKKFFDWFTNATLAFTAIASSYFAYAVPGTDKKLIFIFVAVAFAVASVVFIRYDIMKMKENKDQQ